MDFDHQGCDHGVDVGVTCSQGGTCTQGAVRLQGSMSAEGQVEVCHLDVWGSVCADHWDNVNARVICRELGLPSSGKHYLISTCVHVPSCSQLSMLL